MRFGGAMLVIVGLLLVTGAWTEFTIWLRVTLPGFETVI
jgi:cytochrome c-type biogenesis protein